MNIKVFLFIAGFIAGLFVFDMWWGVILAFVCVVWWTRKRGEKVTAVVVFFIIGVLVGAARMVFSDLIFENDVRLLNGTGVKTLVVCVGEEVDVRDKVVKYTVNDVAADGSGVAFGGEILINAPRYPEYKYGDVLEVRGELKTPEKMDDFDYGKYLSRYGVYSVMDGSGFGNGFGMRKIGDGCGSKFFKAIYSFKGIVEKRIEEVFPEPYASMINGLLLGSRKGIPKDLTDAFNKVGLSHIVAISGYNITLVISLVFGLFGFLGRRARAITASLFVMIFVVLVGMSSSVVRAGIMGVITMMGLYFGRRGLAVNSILISAFLMNIWNPKIAVYDVGFQLSFLATLGLLYASKFYEKLWLIKKLPRFFMIRENLALTLSAQTFAMPVILRSFGRFSIFCPIVNILVLPFVPFAMLFSALALVFGGIFAFPCKIVLDIIFFFVKIFASI